MTPPMLVAVDDGGDDGPLVMIVSLRTGRYRWHELGVYHERLPWWVYLAARVGLCAAVVETNQISPKVIAALRARVETPEWRVSRDAPKSWVDPESTEHFIPPRMPSFAERFPDRPIVLRDQDGNPRP